jgi:26S proteasome regulatory subunit N2
MMHMFSLALTPTLTIGLTRELKYPKKFHIVCNAKPSTFAYPKKTEEKKEKEKKRVETATLSITAKEKARQARKKAKMGDADMEVDDTKSETKEGEESTTTTMEVDKDAESTTAADAAAAAAEKPKKKREPEPTSFHVDNPARVTKTQALVCAFDTATQRYRPIRPQQAPVGVIILTDRTPEQIDDELGAVKPPSLEPEGETAPPEPFEWTPPPLPIAEESAAEEEEDAMKEEEEAAEEEDNNKA